MTTLFHSASVGAFGSLQRSRGLAVAYRRGDDAIGPQGGQITIVPATGRFVVEGDDGVKVSGQERDWLISASDLALNGQSTEPKRGDLIRLTTAAGTLVFEVGSLAGEKHFRAWDVYGSVLRVHSRHIETEQ